ncbi:PIN domain-containing protein [Streptomyces sp. NPDC046374]|uniref:PIN domain-containing protein n=1 Tax=Streptomyces sp. NPDC046374 TaxID=3154917 RepID=UPI0034086DF1
MIILDTNILKQVSLRGLEAELLRAIRASGAEQVAAPWIALEEIAAQEALRYAQKHEEALERLDALAKASPWDHIPRPRRTPPEKVREHWRDRYMEIVDVLQTSPAAYQEAMFREANVIAPCKKVSDDKHKTGSRDAAIWLTAVEYAVEHPDDTVYFITADGDFGRDGALPDAMAQDLKGIDERFVRFTSLSEVLTKFAKEVEPDAEAVRSALNSHAARKAVGERARQELRRGRIMVSIYDPDAEDLRRVSLPRWPCGPEVALSDVRDIRTHEIDEHTWCTATARWLLSAHRRPYAEDTTVNCVWETRVMLRPSSPTEGITITPLMRGEPISLDDVPHLPTLDHDHRAEVEDLSRTEVAMVNQWMAQRADPWFTTEDGEDIYRAIRNLRAHGRPVRGGILPDVDFSQPD